MLRDFRPLLPLVAVLVAAGCAGTRHEVKVESTSLGRPVRAQSFRITSADPALGEENLRYKEAADYVRTALSGRGLFEAPSADRAEVVVEIEYGMRTPRSVRTRANLPVSAPTPAGGPRESARPSLAGYDLAPASATPTYEKYLRVTARESQGGPEGRPPAELWSVRAAAEDGSNDLRRYLPVLASALVETIGVETGRPITVRVVDDGAAVGFIRRGMDESPPGSQPRP